MTWTGLPISIQIAGELTAEERERVPQRLARRRTLWRTLREVRYLSMSGAAHVLKRVELVVVPAGWITDLTSIPWWLPWKRREGEHTAASVVHDWCYAKGYTLTPDLGGEEASSWSRRQRINRKQADQLYLEAMLSLGVGLRTARLIYLGVRLGGRGAWRRYRA